MAACGKGAAVEEAPALPALSDAHKKTLAGLQKLDWGKGGDFKGKGVSGTIRKAQLKGWDGAWVKSDKTFEGMTLADFQNYQKYLAETSLKDKAIPKAENVKKNADGTVCSLWAVMKLGMMISNRDMHVDIKTYALGDIAVDDMKCDGVQVWADSAEPKDSPKKTVRMKVLSFSLGMETDKGFRMVDFDNYNFGGSLPTKIVNSVVGNKDDYIAMAGYMATIKKNGGKFK